MQKSNPKYKLLHPHYFFRKMAYPISKRISTPIVAKMPHTNSGINIYFSFLCVIQSIRKYALFDSPRFFASCSICSFSLGLTDITTCVSFLTRRLSGSYFLPAIISPPFYYSATRHSFLCRNIHHPP